MVDYIITNLPSFSAVRYLSIGVQIFDEVITMSWKNNILIINRGKKNQRKIKRHSFQSSYCAGYWYEYVPVKKIRSNACKWHITVNTINTNRVVTCPHLRIEITNSSRPREDFRAQILNTQAHQIEWWNGANQVRTANNLSTADMTLLTRLIKDLADNGEVMWFQDATNWP